MRGLTLAPGALSTSQSAQTPEERPFEVASVKATPTPTPFANLTFSPGGRLVCDNVTAGMLIAMAFGGGRPLTNTRIVGRPQVIW